MSNLQTKPRMDTWIVAHNRRTDQSQVRAWLLTQFQQQEG